MAANEFTTLARPNRSLPHNIVRGLPTATEDTGPLYIKADGNFLEAPASAVIDSARRLTLARFRPGAPVLDDLERLYEFLQVQLGPRDREVFALILLDNHRKLIDYVELFEGTIDFATVWPRDVVMCALSKCASSVVLVHNHPSGLCEPSIADKAVTTRLKQALALIEIKVLDHLIIGTSMTSMAARGMV
ncbi:MAG: JAB domain-containing protein [Gammaproteobacteria bacterium]